MDINALVSKLNPQKMFHYDGSLTTPGCSEIVQWIVVNEPQPISEQQLAFFTSRWANNPNFAKGRGNNRATQPLNGRAIYYYNSSLILALSTIGVFLGLALASF